MTCKASQTPEAGSLVKTASLPTHLTTSIRRRNLNPVSFLLNLTATWVQVHQSSDFCLWRISQKGAHCLLTAPPWPWCSPWCLRCSCSWVSTVPFYSLVYTWNIALDWLWIETFCSGWVHWFSIDVSGGAGAQSVTQPDGHITVSEGARLELRCNYSSSFSSYLFWYIQYPNQGLQLLLKYTSGNSLVSGIKGFEAEFRRSEKSFHLRKTSAHWKDSAKYFCALSDTVTKTTVGAEHKSPET